MMIAEPHHICLIFEVAWGNTQDIHCSVNYIAHVLMLLDKVDDGYSQACVDDDFLVTRFMNRSWLMMQPKDSRQTELFSFSCNFTMGRQGWHFQVTITVPEHLSHFLGKTLLENMSSSVY